MLYLTNAFSINMFPDDENVATLLFSKLNQKVAAEMVASQNAVCAIGHPDTARVVQNHLGVKLDCQRVNVTFRPGRDRLVVAQYRGPRLEPGATELPDGATIEYWFVELAEV